MTTDQTSPDLHESAGVETGFIEHPRYADYVRTKRLYEWEMMNHNRDIEEYRRLSYRHSFKVC